MDDWSNTAFVLGIAITMISGVWAAALADSVKSFARHFVMRFLELLVMVLVASFFGAYMGAALFS